MLPVQYILLDIEGTVSPIPFVHQVLFPYAKERLQGFVAAHAADDVVKACLADTKQTVQRESGRELNDEAATVELVGWIDADRKHPALKTLQGLIWREGYELGAFVAQLYPEVHQVLTAWKQQGLGLGIYSSGSVQAQKLLFKHTPAGDMTPLFSHFFDTGVGGKREVTAYREILSRLQRPAASVVFLSDIADELSAATTAGMRAIQLVRPGTTAAPGQQTAVDLHQVEQILTTKSATPTNQAHSHQGAKS